MRGKITIGLVLFSFTMMIAQSNVSVFGEKKGCISGDCINGSGTYIYKDGTKYEGDFEDRMANGKGISHYTNGDIYEGAWKNHTFHGKGTLFLSNGEKKFGWWINGDLKEEIFSSNNQGNVYALIIGVSTYADYNDLKYAKNDAKQFYSFLRSPEGGQIPINQIALVTDEKASKIQLLASIDDVFAKADTNDTVIFYFAGNGSETAILPADYLNEYDEIKVNTIIDIVNQSKAKSKIAIIDMYYNNRMKDALVAEKGKSDIRTKYQNALESSRGGTAILLSINVEERSIERNSVKSGAFNYYLMEGIKGSADVDNNEIITIEELFKYTKQNIQEYTNYEQSPTFIGSSKNDIPMAVTDNK